MGSIGTTFRVHSFIPSEPKVSFQSCPGINFFVGSAHFVQPLLVEEGRLGSNCAIEAPGQKRCVC